MGIYSEAMEEITWYTGLSPAAFFTIAALTVVVYKTVTSMFVSPEDFNKPPVAMSFNDNDSQSTHLLSNYLGGPSPTTTDPNQHLGDMTEQELRRYDGSDPDKPLLIAIKGQIYDVSSSRMFYGRGGPYAMFAGREASRALALLSFKPQDINGNLEDLGPEELQILEDWEFKFIEKYPKVGQLLVPDQQTQPAAADKEDQNHGSENLHE
ncbi:hypothetical protein FNV43_RR15408 [Rhamnella rubrinervis]|uniref:Cytochrome b5 heme-binding domain-containing protein n=1 Tax=Rhamnella rubrinervis TaxID=2594499 RepID=A0A8K0E8S1_9ROSA|nr:hypothetical protein FNV43_RR15408 [Rhamnella rubrinervis]